MSCPMCDLGISICGEVRNGDGFRAEHYLCENRIFGWELWAANRDENGELDETTVVPVDFCPWCGRKLDGKGDGE